MNITLIEFCSSREPCLTWSLFLFQFSKLVLVDTAICVSCYCFLRHEVYSVLCWFARRLLMEDLMSFYCVCLSVEFMYFLIHFANFSLSVLTLLSRSWIGTIYFSLFSSKLLKFFVSLPHSINTKSNYNFPLLFHASFLCDF